MKPKTSQSAPSHLNPLSTDYTFPLHPVARTDLAEPLIQQFLQPSDDLATPLLPNPVLVRVVNIQLCDKPLRLLHIRGGGGGGVSELEQRRCG